MPEILHATVQSTADIRELAISACAGDWATFWDTWTRGAHASSLHSPQAGAALHIIDWLASELRQPLPCRLDDEWWPKEASHRLSCAGMTVVACLSADDGRRFLKTALSEQMNLMAVESIVRAYDTGSGDSAMADAFAYLREIAISVAELDEMRLLIITDSDSGSAVRA